MKIALWILGGLGAFIVLVAIAMIIIGALLPEKHQASVSVELPAKSPDVYKVITDYESMPQWWPAVKSIEKQTIDGQEVWINADAHGNKIPFLTEKSEKDKLLVRRILDKGIPFGGTWTFVLDESNGKTRLTVTEDGFVRNLFFRTMARFVFGYNATLNDFAKNISKKFGAQN